MYNEKRSSAKYSGKEIFFALCVVLFAGVIRIPSLAQPIGPDQGIMAVIGEGILNGKLPYRDFWEMASPAIFFTYALMFKVFGPNMVAIPITDMLVSMFTTFMVFILSRYVWGTKTGYVSALLFAIFSAGTRLGMHAAGDTAFGTFWYLSQRETFMLPLIVSGLFFTLRSERKGWQFGSLFMSGMLTGLSFVYKFPSALFFGVILVYLNWSLLTSGRKKLLGRLIKNNIVLLSGFIIAIAPFVLYFQYKGVLPEMIEIIFKYVYSVYGEVEHDMFSTVSLGLRRTFFFAQENFILWIFFATSSFSAISRISFLKLSNFTRDTKII